MSQFQQGNPVRTVRMAEREQAKLLAQLARQDIGPSGPDRRRIRVPFEGQTVIVILNHPTSASDKYAVIPRNLSAQGMAFIHGQFVHAGLTCKIVLPNLQKQWVAVQGKINHCRHVEGIIHEVAIRFNETLNLEQFVGLTPEQADRYREEYIRDRAAGRMAANAGKSAGAVPLSGSVLLVDNLEMDRQLLALWLGGQGLSVAQANHGEQALAEIKRCEPALVLLDLHLGDPWDQELARTIRKSGYRGPIAAVSADESDNAQAAVMAAGCNAFLGKPCERTAFVQMVEQLLTPESDGPPGGVPAPIRSAMSDDFQMARMVSQYIESLPSTLEKLAAAASGKDFDALKIICHQIKGTAGSYGLAPVSQASRLALGQLQQPQPDLAAIKKAVDELIEVARRVSAK